MISVKHINEKDIDSCYELDSSTTSLWSKKQWASELKKEGINSTQNTPMEIFRGN